MSREPSINDFGLLIAYGLPGYAALWAASYLSEPLRAWIGVLPAEGQTVGGFLYTTVAAIGAGLTVSTLRWMVIDTLHHKTGVRPPEWDFSRLRESSAAFNIIVEHYFRYYQFGANTFLALLLVVLARRGAEGSILGFDGLDGILIALMAVLFVGSRDSLKRYYTRGGQLLREAPRPRRTHPAPRHASRLPQSDSDDA